MGITRATIILEDTLLYAKDVLNQLEAAERGG